MRFKEWILIAGAVLPSFSAFAITDPSKAALRPEKVFTVENKKMDAYIEDGLFVGGDRAINSVEIEGIRFSAKTPGGHGAFERLVIDERVFQNGRSPVVQRPSYFQAALSPDLKQLTVTLWGKPKLDFDKLALSSAIKKSTSIQAIRLFPPVEQDSWTFTLDLKTPVIAEVFELDHPVRIILDLKKSR